MKRIKLHICAFILFAPFIILLMSSTIILQILSAVYFGWLVFGFSSTIIGRRFFLRYYREILRLEEYLKM